MAADAEEVPVEVVSRLRRLCLGLPEAYEENAWVGTRWRVRKHTFAHVLMVDGDWPPAYARAASAEEPILVLTFRASGPELEALSAAGHPYFRPQWGPNVVGMVLDEDVDWDEVGELLTESYCVLAPKMLVERVKRPTF
ncbi:MmcQ/YjbR family DNA-binding protein [Antrihabitans sp. YC2-6]|uniref:MmcQ/YjbR family DNA-binding protein n=1 Tax=Antrihabitans sp. YC2-6 TaxID=2799498 RepID=UPI0018F3332C|nr:MmcQ/YjbR family DNA-binding protein [Antrihabitans sp. YC2-6]MBJ8348761.1 MmcQ/YjbR family DNA-binding protein [Antrihabitans sp. YC2-6]